MRAKESSQEEWIKNKTQILPFNFKVCSTFFKEGFNIIVLVNFLVS